MHELALAEAIVAIVEEHARGRQVARVELQVGRLRQVVPDALAFNFELVAHGTAVDGAELSIEEVPVRLLCAACGRRAQADELPLACRRCGSVDVQVERGEEFHVVALELEDEPITVGRR